ncbi:DUF1573 domain-containing protein [bacterium]|nr:DUF1573 domain-containing protein [bacterium]
MKFSPIAFGKSGLLLIALFLPDSVWAALNWQYTELSQSVTALSQEANASFAFTNTGDTPVSITAITSSCGCTTAELEKKTYAPGESGEIVAKFKIGGRQGLQTKTIQVKTDDSDTPTVLTMKTLIPKLLDLQPAFVAWKRGVAPDARTVIARIGADEAVHITKIETDNPAVQVQLEETEPGKTYRLTLFPDSTDESLTARITLSTDFPREKPRTFYLLAHVK